MTNPYQPSAVQPQGAAPQYQDRGYEFDQTENQTIDRLAHAMRFVGIFSVIVAALQFVGGVFLILGDPGRGIGVLGEGIFYLVMGIWTMGAAKHFSAIVTTQGSDIPNLMIALEQLRKLYSLVRVFILILLGFIVLGFVFALLLLPRASHG